MLSLTIPIWLLVIIVVLLIVSFLIFLLNKNSGGDYDFFTPIAVFTVLFVAVGVIVGILLGKFVF